MSLKIIFVALICACSSLSALTYKETVSAFEEALENQSVRVYLLKEQKKEKERQLLHEAFTKPGGPLSK